MEGCSPATHRSYANRLSLFFRFLENEACQDISEIQRYHIEKYLMAMKSRKCSPHWVNGCFRSLRTFFNFCVLEEIIKQSPMRNMKPPKLPKIGKPFMSLEQRDRLLHANRRHTFVDARNRAIIWAFWTTGMRLSELTGLKLEDLQWGRAGRIKVFGKGSKERYVPFEPEAQQAVSKYLRFRKDGDHHLWLSDDGLPLAKWGVTSALRRSGELAGIKVKDVNHIFRRTWAWERIKEGVNPKYIMLVGGWTTIDVLLQYVKAIEIDEALDKIREAHHRARA